MCVGELLPAGGLGCALGLAEKQGAGLSRGSKAATGNASPARRQLGPLGTRPGTHDSRVTDHNHQRVFVCPRHCCELNTHGSHPVLMA